jgi:hypothetical protein
LPEYHHVFRRKKAAWLDTRGLVAILMAKYLADQPHGIGKAVEALDIARTVLEEARSLEPENEYAKKHWRQVLELEKKLQVVATTR